MKISKTRMIIYTNIMIIIIGYILLNTLLKTNMPTIISGEYSKNLKQIYNEFIFIGNINIKNVIFNNIVKINGNVYCENVIFNKKVIIIGKLTTNRCKFKKGLKSKLGNIILIDTQIKKKFNTNSKLHAINSKFDEIKILKKAKFDKCNIKKITCRKDINKIPIIFKNTKVQTILKIK